MVAHHHGMFAFNTAAPEGVDAAALATGPGLTVFRARLDYRYRMGSLGVVS